MKINLSLKVLKENAVLILNVLLRQNDRLSTMFVKNICNFDTNLSMNIEY